MTLHQLPPSPCPPPNWAYPSPDAFWSTAEDHYAKRDMNSDIGRWELRRRERDSAWSVASPHSTRSLPQSPHSPHFLPKPISRTHTSPIPPRPDLVRHSSYGRPSSSGELFALPFRERHSSLPQITPHVPAPLQGFRRSDEWPPRGYPLNSLLSPKDAEDLICPGASTFKGYRDEIANMPGHFRFFAVMEAENYQRTDRAAFQCDAFKDMSLTVTGSADDDFPWVALEQPCMAYSLGKSPGTTTLTYHVGKYGSVNPPMPVGTDVRPKKMKLVSILDRLRRLEAGFADQGPEDLYRHLYNTLIDDPEKHSRPHRGMELQMADLITVLGHKDWIDFSLPKNQVVAKFFDSTDAVVKQRFFHQLLLSMELYLRIHSPEHLEKAKRKLLLQLPPKIAWDLALARRWRDHMVIEKSRTSSSQSTFSFELRSKKRQKEALRQFAAILKWPNMDELGYILDEKDRKEKPLEDRSADAMSWFTGVVLPGPTLPWLLMNSLIDCDRDTGEALKYLTHMHSNSGFQYRANTYWSYACIVGKVLGAARSVSQVAGWIGPCNYTPDLKRTECVLIRQAAPPELPLTNRDIDDMARRTNPLGPEDTEYPLDDYELLLPDMEELEDVIRIEKLSFTPMKEQPGAVARMGDGAPLTFDAGVVFAVGGLSVPVKLRYNVDFLAAFPCHGGPHVLFYEYKYRAVKVDSGLLELRWPLHSSRHRRSRRSSRGTPHTPHSNSSGSTSRSHSRSLALRTTSSSYSRPESPASLGLSAVEVLDEVLVIEAFGVSDNEVFARAWCADRGVHAVIAKEGETCMACAIREAFAAGISVVIMTQGGRIGEGDEGVDPGV